MTFRASFSIMLAVSLITCAARAQDNPRDAHRKAELSRYALLAKRSAHTLSGANDYDVTSYVLKTTFPKDGAAFSGAVTMAFQSTVASLSTVVVNAASNLTIDSVTSAMGGLVFSHAGDTLTVTLATPLPQGAPSAITMWYSSTYANAPAITRRSLQNVDLGVPTVSISSQSEPYDARVWWPCKDDPADKADSVDVYVTTDSSLFCVSNGVLVSDVRDAGGNRTFHWACRYPIATYLVSVAMARYSVRQSSFTHGGTTMPVYNWWYGMPAAQMQPNMDDMLAGLRVYSELFGTYPFIKEKYAMAEYEAFGGSMEHQTATSMGFYGTGVVVHELAHQWFGDKVTCASFEHIWLNEGWATYCEALFDEARGGLPALKANMAANAYYGPGTIYVYDALTKGMGEIFNGSLSYNKASWVIHMVRHVVGDSTFFAAVRKYLGATDRPAYRSVTTEEFEGFLERESGKDLKPFFQNWIYGQYYPTYKFAYSSTPVMGGYSVTVSIDQLPAPATQIFDMPIDLSFTFDTFDTTIVVQNNTRTATYNFTFPSRPLLVQLDKDDWILKRVVEPVINPTFDKGILLVNGVDWDVSAYTADIKAAYADSIFTGNKPYTFWDLFPHPAAGYPPNITTPAGSGAVPASILGSYCTIVWVGNAYNGDDAIWQNTSIWEYVKAGGNVILITRMGDTFITQDLQQFLGISWTASNQPIQECLAQQSWLTDIGITGDQSLVTAFSPQISRPENEILYMDTKAFTSPQAIGVRGLPMLVDGEQTGYMAFLSMRPYRVNGVQLKTNMQALLDRTPCVPRPTSVSATPPSALSLELLPGYPNPVMAGGVASLAFRVPDGATRVVTIRVYDALGRLVAEPASGMYRSGLHVVQLPTSFLPAGIYTILAADGSSRTARNIIVI